MTKKFSNDFFKWILRMFSFSCKKICFFCDILNKFEIKFTLNEIWMQGEDWNIFDLSSCQYFFVSADLLLSSSGFLLLIGLDDEFWLADKSNFRNKPILNSVKVVTFSSPIFITINPFSKPFIKSTNHIRLSWRYICKSYSNK